MSTDLAQRLKTVAGLSDNLRTRSRLLTFVRQYFNQAEFVEVETPRLSLWADPAPHLESFSSSYSDETRQENLYLPTSPEHHMKRMVAAGFERIYQVCRFFRNGEMGPLHNPEFTGLEWYQAGQTFEDMIHWTEEFVRQAALQLAGRSRFRRAGYEVDLGGEFRRMTVAEALKDLAGVQVPDDWNEPDLRRALSQAGIEPAADDTFDDLVNRALVHKVESALAGMGPVFLTEYPAPMAALARLKPENKCVAERFELFIAGLELCNGYGELSDPREQRQRFLEQIQARRSSGLSVPRLDTPFLSALERGMPAASGNALGLDRLLMLICEAERIEQVLAFPMSEELE